MNVYKKFKSIEIKYSNQINVQVINVKQKCFLLVRCKISYINDTNKTKKLIYDIIEATIQSRQSLLINNEVYSLVTSISEITYMVQLNFGQNDKEIICCNAYKNLIDDKNSMKYISLTHENICRKLNDYDKVIVPNSLILEFVYKYL